jgi:hypothetical protein
MVVSFMVRPFSRDGLPRYDRIEARSSSASSRPCAVRTDECSAAVRDHDLRVQVVVVILADEVDDVECPHVTISEGA